MDLHPEGRPTSRREKRVIVADVAEATQPVLVLIAADTTTRDTATEVETGTVEEVAVTMEEEEEGEEDADSLADKAIRRSTTGTPSSTIRIGRRTTQPPIMAATERSSNMSAETARGI